MTVHRLDEVLDARAAREAEAALLHRATGPPGEHSGDGEDE